MKNVHQNIIKRQKVGKITILFLHNKVGKVGDIFLISLYPSVCLSIQKFLSVPNEVFATNGGNTSLTCLVENMGGECRWQKDGKVDVQVMHDIHVNMPDLACWNVSWKVQSS